MQLVGATRWDWLPMGTVQGGRPCPLPHLHLGGRKDIRGWVNSNMQPPHGSDQGTRSPWMNVDGPEGVRGAFPGHRASAPGQLCEEAEPGFWAPSSFIMKPPGELIPVTGPPPVGVSCLMMWIHPGVVPGHVWT